MVLDGFKCKSRGVRLSYLYQNYIRIGLLGVMLSCKTLVNGEKENMYRRDKFENGVTTFWPTTTIFLGFMLLP